MALEIENLLDLLESRIKTLTEKVNYVVASHVETAQRVQSVLGSTNDILDSLLGLEAKEEIQEEKAEGGLDLLIEEVQEILDPTLGPEDDETTEVESSNWANV